MERTLIVIKPDGVKRGLVGAILSRFEDKGFKMAELKMTVLSREKAESFYLPHKDKFFFDSLVDFITSGPVVATILEGPCAVSAVRRMIGTTNSAEAAAGTVRGDYSLDVTENTIHAADSPENFSRESKIIFG